MNRNTKMDRIWSGSAYCRCFWRRRRGRFTGDGNRQRDTRLGRRQDRNRSCDRGSRCRRGRETRPGVAGGRPALAQASFSLQKDKNWRLNLHTHVHRGVRLSPGMPHSGSRRYRAKIRLLGARRLQPTELRGIKRRNSKTKTSGAGGPGPPATSRSHRLSAIRIVDRHPVHRGLDGQRLYSYYNPD